MELETHKQRAAAVTKTLMMTAAALNKVVGLLQRGCQGELHGLSVYLKFPPWPWSPMVSQCKFKLLYISSMLEWQERGTDLG